MLDRHVELEQVHAGRIDDRDAPDGADRHPGARADEPRPAADLQCRLHLLAAGSHSTKSGGTKSGSNGWSLKMPNVARHLSHDTALSHLVALPVPPQCGEVSQQSGYLPPPPRHRSRWTTCSSTSLQHV